MTHQLMADTSRQYRGDAHGVTAPDAAVRVVGALLGAGPFAGYVLSRSVGVPGDPGDVGNWGDWVGTVSLFIEAALVVLSVSMLLAYRRSAVRGGSGRQAGHQDLSHDSN